MVNYIESFENWVLITLNREFNNLTNNEKIDIIDKYELHNEHISSRRRAKIRELKKSLLG